MKHLNTLLYIYGFGHYYFKNNNKKDSKWQNWNDHDESVQDL